MLPPKLRKPGFWFTTATFVIVVVVLIGDRLFR